MERNYRTKAGTDSKWHPSPLACAWKLGLERCPLSKTDPLHEGRFSVNIGLWGKARAEFQIILDLFERQGGTKRKMWRSPFSKDKIHESHLPQRKSSLSWKLHELPASWLSALHPVPYTQDPCDHPPSFTESCRRGPYSGKSCEEADLYSCQGSLGQLHILHILITW